MADADVTPTVTYNFETIKGISIEMNFNLISSFIFAIRIMLLLGWVAAFQKRLSSRNHFYTTLESRSSVRLSASQTISSISPSSPFSATELPLDFDDAVQRAVQSTLRALPRSSQLRIEFDTSGADRTYSSLHHSLPFVKSYTKLLSDRLNLSLYDNSNITSSSAVTETIRLFLPDTGAAASLRSQWRLRELRELRDLRGLGQDYQDSYESTLPTNLVASSILDEETTSSDRLVIVVCPLYSEAEALRRLISRCQDYNSFPVILINPDLVHPEQGYGIRARALQREVIDASLLVYQLRSLSLGALVYEYSQCYSFWERDESQETGYSLSRSFESSPSGEDLSEMLVDIAAKTRGGSSSSSSSRGGGGLKNGLTALVEGMSRLMKQLQRL